MASLSRSTFRCLQLHGPAKRICHVRPAAPSSAIRAVRSESLRFYSADATDKVPKGLKRIKDDLKTAMRAKDAPRLAVLRAVLAANLNASKTDKPIQTDVQLVSLLRKVRKGAEEAAAEAEAVQRQDLVDKEMQQAYILDEYIEACGVRKMGEAELEAIIKEAVEAVKADAQGAKNLMGQVMSKVMAKVAGQDVDKQSLSQMVVKATGGKPKN